MIHKIYPSNEIIKGITSMIDSDVEYLLEDCKHTRLKSCFHYTLGGDSDYTYAIVMGWHRTDNKGSEDNVWDRVCLDHKSGWHMSAKLARKSRNHTLQGDYDLYWEFPISKNGACLSVETPIYQGLPHRKSVVFLLENWDKMVEILNNEEFRKEENNGT